MTLAALWVFFFFIKNNIYAPQMHFKKIVEINDLNYNLIQVY